MGNPLGLSVYGCTPTCQKDDGSLYYPYGKERHPGHITGSAIRLVAGRVNEKLADITQVQHLL
jgi:hypothetical protein